MHWAGEAASSQSVILRPKTYNEPISPSFFNIQHRRETCIPVLRSPRRFQGHRVLQSLYIYIYPLHTHTIHQPTQPLFIFLVSSPVPSNFCHILTANKGLQSYDRGLEEVLSSTRSTISRDPAHVTIRYSRIDLEPEVYLGALLEQLFEAELESCHHPSRSCDCGTRITYHVWKMKM